MYPWDMPTGGDWVKLCKLYIQFKLFENFTQFTKLFENSLIYLKIGNIDPKISAG